MSSQRIDYNLIKEAREVAIDSVLRDYNIRYSHRRGDSSIYYCPFHNDRKNPNLSVSKSKNLWHCWRCGLGGDVVDLVGYLKYGTIYDRDSSHYYNAVEHLVSNNYRYVYPEENNEETYYDFKETEENIFLYEKNLSGQSLEYLWYRGIRNPSNYRIGEKVIDTVKYITIPLFYNCNLIGLKCRRNDFHKKLNIKHYTVPGSNCSMPYTLFDKNDKKVFFFEDIISAISAHELGFPAISLCGGNSIPNKGVAEFKKILRNKSIILVPDSDKAGRKLYEDCKRLGIKISKKIEIPDYKDFNDLLQNNNRRAFKTLLSNM